ncbi:hypothetical protein PITCH_A1430028 [uncultured Desulfobacterium sp.]|uniref:HTH merR-type domain-containing protein n=1 Tax=uncultured Desulfobacterium sp. TaxID=201089 RepID=A0A445MSX9_9BACT|nr:hypothetical protein PITCH_A1430028 [uncultured Desulfobacterium sp.]
MLTLHEVSQKTGLSQNFIRLCKTKLGDILNPYLYRGDKNKLLFDDNCIMTFDKIRKLKDDGLSISDIVRGFKQEFTVALLNTNKDKLNLKHAEHLYNLGESTTSVDTLLKNMIHG